MPSHNPLGRRPTPFRRFRPRNLLWLIPILTLGTSVLLGPLMLVLPVLFSLFCFADMIGFLRSPRIARHRKLPETVDLPTAPEALEQRKPRKREVRPVPPWFQPPGIGPRGYR